MTEFTDLPDSELIRIYLDSPVGSLNRCDQEEALWEYWSRIIDGNLSFEHDDLVSAIATGLYGVGNVVGGLAKSDLIPERDVVQVLDMVSSLGTADAEWGRRMLRARAMVIDARHGHADWSTSALRSLVGKGLGWAVLEVLPTLRCSDAQYLVDLVSGSSEFPKSIKRKVREWRP